MGDRGKRSTADLAIIKPSGITAVQRPDAPDCLSDEEAHEWKQVVARMPADWFPRETHGLLEQYCRHRVSARRVAELIASLLAGETESDRWVDDYDKLLKMQEREGRAMSSLATRMRISQHAQYNHKKKTGSTMKKPWET